MNFILIPILTALLAWFIAWLFVKAIFMSWNKGLLQQIESIEPKQLITGSKMNSSFEAVLPFIDQALDEFFKHKLSSKMPIVSMFIGDNTITQLKAVFIEELQLLFPVLVQKILYNAKDDFVKNLQKKWSIILEPILLKATRPFRLLAFLIGIIWGILILLVFHHC